MERSPRSHDVGGMRHLGPIEVEQDEPVFHSDWEAKVFGMTMATLGKGLFSLEEFRGGIEDIHPVSYMDASYYERWLVTLERWLVQGGVLTPDEIDERTRELALHPDRPVPDVEDPQFADVMISVCRGGIPLTREVDREPRFAIGDRVRAIGTDTTWHTRLPAYARGKVGEVVRIDAAYVFPDTNALREGENPEHTYGVRFEAAELWGDDAEGRAPVHVDLYETYLEPA